MSPLAITEVGDIPLEEVNSVLVNNPGQNIRNATANASIGKGQVVQKNYVLNDTGALKKKLRHETRKDPFNLGTEARNGSSMVVEMKTSFFEHVKSEFIKELITQDGIKNVDNAIGAIANTEKSGEAFVEYSLDITFTVKEKVHAVKLTAYTTTCRIMFQPIGEPAHTKVQHSNKSIPRYFADTYFLPWCEKAFEKKNYDEKEILDAIRNEIKRLDLTKVVSRKGNLTRNRVASLPNSESKCVARGCKYTGLNSNNKTAVGVCAKCGSFEHFECSKTKQEERDDILRGTQKYFCSICFSNNPSMIAFESLDSSKEAGPGSDNSSDSVLYKPSASDVPPPPPVPVEAVVKYKCRNCNFEAGTQEELKEHDVEHHTFECNICRETFTNTSEVEAHVEQKHKQEEYNCSDCTHSYKSKDELNIHVEKEHDMQVTYHCTRCDNIFTTQSDLQAHTVSNHSSKCPLCDQTFTDNEDFLKHMKTEHAPSCDICNIRFENKELLQKHIEKEHISSNIRECSSCNEKFRNNDLFEQHMKTTHILEQAFKCAHCDEEFATEKELDGHVENVHTMNVDPFECRICNFTGKTVEVMQNHIIEKHYHTDENNQFTCDECVYKCDTRRQLKKHFEEHHGDICPVDNQNKPSNNEIKLKEELKLLKKSFQRLESMYQDAQEEANNVKSEYEAKIMEANDRVRTITAENEALKEKVDILFKLGRSYINQKENTSSNDHKRVETDNKQALNTSEEEIETVTIDDNGVEDLQTWTQNKMRGFKRTGPSSDPVRNNSVGSKKPEQHHIPRPPPTITVSSPSSPAAPSSPSTTPRQTVDSREVSHNPHKNSHETRMSRSPRYCHYFVNYGQCSFEERTGQKCKFEHRQAPMCNSGTSCTKTKCMFMHPKPSENSRRNNFLGQFIPPWNIINPWMNQMQTPWNIPPMQWNTGANQFQN